MFRSVLILFALVLIVSSYALMSGSVTEDVNAGLAATGIKKPAPLIIEEKENKSSKEKPKTVKKLNSVDANTELILDENLVDTVDSDLWEEDLSEEEIRKAEEKLFIKDFMASKKANRKYKSREEKKNDFSTISGKGTGGMKAKWRKQQREKQRQAELEGNY